MMQGLLDIPIQLVGRFQDRKKANDAKAVVSGMLKSAKKEVDELFRRQDGVADMADVIQIYERYGFHNSDGWEQERPITTEDESLFWTIPDGMVLEEAQELLLAMGAISVEIQFEDDMSFLSEMPHPMAFYLTEPDIDGPELEEDDLLGPSILEKKTIH